MIFLAPWQLLLTIAALALGTQLTRWLPFLLFPPHKKTPGPVLRLGRLLPYAVTSLLVVYCLRDVSFVSGSHGLPEGIAVLVVVLLHIWKQNALLSIGLGTAAYMLLVQQVF